ncbi:hypothetical protein L1887_15444 [Cichorium endivia]|nr:hypothetical protein L1887_15444 [Cichorium endivia]
MDATTNLDKIEAIYVCLFWGEELQRVLQVAANMKKLRWIGLDCKSIMETSSPTIEPCSETTLRNLKLRQFWEDYKNRDRIEAITSWCCWSDKSRVLQVAANMTNQVFLKSLQSRVPLMVETTIPSNVVTAFPPRELCCLTFDNLHAKQLWAGYKYLPNLKMVNLLDLENLIETPDFEGLPNLERFMVDGAPLLEEIHPSFGRLEKLVSVAIQYCKNLKIVPPITRSMKLETVVLSNCRNLFKSSKTQQNMENSIPQNMDHIGLWFISRCLRKLNLSWCNLGDGDIRSAADWELPNLQELNLEGNKFSRLNFNLSRFHRLKWLDITDCYDLVELSELPSSIAVIVADCCTSLKTLGDISNYKWLWKVSLREVTRLGPFVGDILLESMLQGHAKDHFISITTSDIDVWRGFEPCLKWEKKFTMQLPHDWSFAKTLRSSSTKDFVVIFQSINSSLQVMAGVAAEGSQLDTRQFDTKMNELFILCAFKTFKE